MSDKQETIDILVIKQDEKPIRKTIPNTLEAIQHEVGGYLFCFGEKAASSSVLRMNRPACCCSSM